MIASPPLITTWKLDLLGHVGHLHLLVELCMICPCNFPELEEEEGRRTKIILLAENSLQQNYPALDYDFQAPSHALPATLEALAAQPGPVSALIRAGVISTATVLWLPFPFVASSFLRIIKGGFSCHAEGYVKYVNR